MQYMRLAMIVLGLVLCSYYADGQYFHGRYSQAVFSMIAELVHNFNR